MGLYNYLLNTGLRNVRILAFTGLVLFAGVQTYRVAQAHRASEALAYVSDSLQVAADSTRRLQVAGLETSISLWQRRAYQGEQHADFLDKKLKQESAAREKLQLTVDRLVAQISAPVTVDPSDVRHADFHERKTPYTVDIGVDLPKPPAMGVARISVTTDTANVGVRLTCGKPVNGIRPASVTVSTPIWLNVHVDSAAQNTSVCNGTKPSKRWTGVVFGLGAILGYFLH